MTPVHEHFKPVLQLNKRIGIWVSLLVIALGVITLGFQYRAHNKANKVITQIQSVEQNIGLVLLYDESLTMSARMAAATADPLWINRYQELSLKLDYALVELKKTNSDTFIKDSIAQTEESNKKLVAMELESLKAAKEKNTKKATEILYSNEYEKQKLIYTNGMNLLRVSLAQNIKNLKNELFNEEIVVIILFVADASIIIYALRKQLLELVKILNKASAVVGNKELMNQKFALLGDMTANLVHEVKNILAIFKALQESLSRELKKTNQENTSKVSAINEKLASTIGRMETVIKTVGMFSHTAADTTFEAVTIQKILQDTQTFGYLFAEKTMCKLIVEIPQTKVYVQSHGVQISQVLVNMIKNSSEAISEIEDRWIRITGTINEKDKKVILTITDSGKGIPLDLQDKLFKNHISTKVIGSGTGVGLALAKTIIEEHGGTIGINTKSTNTEFVIELPLITETDSGTVAA